MFIKTFSRLSKNDVAIAGGKGASLGEMTKAGIPVPPGFVVLAAAFDVFLTETKLDSKIESILKKTKTKEINSVDRASNEIKKLILAATFPAELGRVILKEFSGLKSPFVAVRSSATAEDSHTASWAGELESYLNTTKNNLLENVKHCWASLFSPRAIFYRYEKKLGTTKVSVAVVVQTMIQSEISGITFTVHPVTEDRNQMVIEAGWGLGEAIVGGKITPDTYVLSKSKISARGGSAFGGKIPASPAGGQNSKRIILDKNISEQKMMIIKSKTGTVEMAVPKNKQEKQKLTDKQLIEIAKICVDIEKHYGFPCDIEWAYAHGKFYVVQSRPITTL
jgi:pyruvate,water dikinase